ncbi:Tyrosine-protein phosphatase non-receptor type substrate 1 [Frankliniella fusca]|uniref:Tyrosine-protein phosphatase non-receptor type substrate 1 n=1 Tax=Frankliniella fusca TaxID=407009 RepID=A0AAE1GZX0_9NEOP|nr:Tyrosine-protein phosphatase non-receptor type substrate 1 [Frankliniella fusca]
MKLNFGGGGLEAGVRPYEKQFELTQSRPSHEESVNITCRAQGVFPEPKMALLRQEDNTRLRRAAVLPGVAVQTHARSGAYDIVATKLLDSEELSTPTILACELRVPATNYTRLKSLVYYPGKAPESPAQPGALRVDMVLTQSVHLEGSRSYIFTLPCLVAGKLNYPYSSESTGE